MIAIDGHDVGEIDRAYAEALETTDKPTLVVARTVKGKGVKQPSRTRTASTASRWTTRKRRSKSPAASGRSESRLRGPRRPSTPFSDQKARTPRYEPRLGDRDPQGLLGSAGRARGRTRRHRRPRRGGLQLDRLRRSSRRSTPTASSRCTSQSSRWSPRLSACRSSAGARSPPPSRRFSPARTTFSAWRR